MKTFNNNGKKKPKPYVPHLPQNGRLPVLPVGAPFSNNKDTKLEAGHGGCLECNCKRFTWK
jgi:hypothetical protein